MARVDEFLAVVEDPYRRALEPGNPADGALLALLAVVAFADGEVDDHELAFLQRVLPGRDPAALRAWAQESGRRPLDLRAVARALPTPEDRWKGLRFGVRMAWKNGELADEERALLTRLAGALELPAGAIDRVLAEVAGRGGAVVDPTALVRAVDAIAWDTLERAKGPLDSDDLRTVVPPGAAPVLRGKLDGVEVIAFFREGLCARFREGAAYLPWRDIVTYTRVPTLAAAVQLHTEDGRVWTLADLRMARLGTLLDRLYGASRPSGSGAPKVEHVRGED